MVRKGSTVRVRQRALQKRRSRRFFFRGPRLVARLAAEREVVLLEDRGVGASTGAVPDNVDDMAREVGRFVDVLGVRQVDVLGCSLGGFVAQELALVRPPARPQDRPRGHGAAGRSQDSPLVGRRVRARDPGRC
jgi:pimeloyl-ACP methyl ester carboxylesterase